MNPRCLQLLAAVAVLPAVVGAACLGCSSQRVIEGSVVQEWVAGYAPGLSSRAVAVDAEGNVYAAGSSDGLQGDYIIVKYDGQGNELWANSYNGPGNAADDAEAVAVDGAGNVYVAGNIDQTTYVPPTGSYGLVKYDASGQEQWVAAYTLGGSYDWLTALALDGHGNVYVSGFSDGGEKSKEDITTIKYNPSGDQLWVARYNGPFNGADKAWAMVVDGAGNVYVTGATFPDSNLRGDYLTLKYNTDGIEQWAVRYDGPASGDDGANAIVVDGEGNVYVTGRVSRHGSPLMALNEDYATVKYDAQGNQLWVALYDGPHRAQDWPQDIAVDGQGNVYVTGWSDNLVAEGPDYATVKYDADGNELWVARYSGPGHRTLLDYDYDDEARDLALDQVGNVYVTGQSDGSRSMDWATVKYNASGEELWLARYDGSDHGYDGADALALDGVGSVYVAGMAGPDGFTVVKYSQEPAERTPSPGP